MEFKKNRLNSIFIKVMCVFVVLILPIYIFGFQIYRVGLDVAHNSVREKIGQQNNNFLDSLLNNVNGILAMEADFLQDNDVIGVAYSKPKYSPYQYMETVNRLERRLNSICYANQSYIECASIVLPDKTVLQVFEPNFSARLSYDTITSIHKDNESPLVFHDGSFFVAMSTKTISKIDNEDGEISITIKLSKSEITRQLRQLCEFDNSFFIVSDLSDNMLFSVNNNGEFTPQDIDLKGFVENEGFMDITHEKNHYAAAYNLRPEIGIKLIRYVDVRATNKIISSLETYIVFFSIMLFVVFIAMYFAMKFLVSKPVKILLNGFSRAETGDFSFKLTHKSNDEFGYIFNRFNRMVAQIKELIEQSYKQKILIQTARLQQLQAQINPHFLYNSIFTLHRMIDMGKYDPALSFSQYLGKYFRFVHNVQNDEIKLSDEWEHAHNFMLIQEMRFSNRIKVHLPEKSLIPDISVPRLIIQPIAENCFLHGLENKSEGGNVWVSFKKNEHNFCICIEDDGGISEEILKSITDRLIKSETELVKGALANVHQRLRIRYKNEGLQLFKNRYGGLTAKIVIPLFDNERNFDNE